jgi:hypothetical protein
MLLCQIYVIGNNKTHVGLQVKCLMLGWSNKKKERSFVHSLLQTYNLAKQIVMLNKSLCSFSVLVFPLNFLRHQTKLINYETINFKYYVSVPVLLLYQAWDHIFSAQHYIVICGLPDSAKNFSTLSWKGEIFGNKLLYIKCVTWSVWNFCLIHFSF